mgnify:CR=1 FL=1
MRSGVPSRVGTAAASRDILRGTYEIRATFLVTFGDLLFVQREMPTGFAVRRVFSFGVGLHWRRQRGSRRLASGVWFWLFCWFQIPVVWWGLHWRVVGGAACYRLQEGLWRLSVLGDTTTGERVSCFFAAPYAMFCTRGWGEFRTLCTCWFFCYLLLLCLLRTMSVVKLPPSSNVVVGRMPAAGGAKGKGKGKGSAKDPSAEDSRSSVSYDPVNALVAALRTVIAPKDPAPKSNESDSRGPQSKQQTDEAEESTYDNMAKQKEEARQLRDEAVSNSYRGGYDRRSARDSRFGRCKFWFPARAMREDPQTGEVAVGDRDSVYCQVSHDWAGIIADGFPDKDLLRAAEGLEAAVPCRVLAVAVPDYVANSVGEDSSVMIGVRAPFGMTGKMSELLGIFDWSRLEDEAEYQKARTVMTEAARSLGLPTFATQREAMEGRRAPRDSNEMAAIIQKAVTDQIQELIRTNVLAVTATTGGQAAGVQNMTGSNVTGGIGATSTTASPGTKLKKGADDSDDDSDATMPPAEDRAGDSRYVQAVANVDNELTGNGKAQSGLVWICELCCCMIDLGFLLRASCVFAIGSVRLMSRFRGEGRSRTGARWVKGAPKNTAADESWNSLTTGAESSPAPVTPKGQSSIKRYVTRSTKKQVSKRDPKAIKPKKMPDPEPEPAIEDTVQDDEL